MTKLEGNTNPKIFLNYLNLSPGKSLGSELKDTMTTVAAGDESVEPSNRKQS